MDPNAALARMRELIELVNSGKADEVTAMEIGVVFPGLDEWLSKGGFLPAAWQR